MSDSDDAPVRDWEHRNVSCTLHRVAAPSGETRWIGYGRFGDRWIELLDRTGVDEDDAVARVESAVDRKIATLEAEGQNSINSDLNRIPDIDTDPNPGIPDSDYPWQDDDVIFDDDPDYTQPSSSD